jgi:hypothetical protein
MQMQPANIEKIKAGTKTTTTRSESQSKQINIPVGESAIVNFGGQDFEVTNRGQLTIEEAGGKEAMLKSEGVQSEKEFMYQQTKDWVNGKGKLYVYDIASTELSTGTKTYSGRITSLKPNQIFVFGSNEGGSQGQAPTHGAGAAKLAKDKFGAIQGQSRGVQGQSYAIVTKKFYDVKRSSTSEEITTEIKALYDYARNNPDKEFLVSDYSETNLNGYSGQEMADMFSNAGPIPSNIVFNENFEKLVSTSAEPVIEEEVTSEQPLRTIKVNQFNITIQPDGKMFFDNGKEVTDQTIKNKVNIRKELQDGTLRVSTYNNSEYFVLLDGRILGSGKTNLGKETVTDPKIKEQILDKAVLYRKTC